MIESYYWKVDLLRHAKILRPIKNPPRWSEKLMVNFEKQLIISFFMIRKLFETYKISQKSRRHKAKVFCFKPRGEKITKLNHYSIDKIYDLKREFKIKKGIVFIANQLIHSCTIFAYRNDPIDRNWGGVFACSDWERDKAIYRVSISEIINIFQLVGNDYPTEIRMTYDKRSDDYKTETN